MKLLITFLSIFLFWIEAQKENSDFLVINSLGAKVFEAPTFESRIINTLSLGQKIQVEKSIPTAEKYYVGPDWGLEGNWIKAQGIEGYIFSSDLTDKEVEFTLDDFEESKFDLKGKLLDQKEEEKKIKNEEGEFPIHMTFEYYENGTYSRKFFDGCFDHIWEFKNLSLSEVYHQMLNDYSEYSSNLEFSSPVFTEKSGNIIRFQVKDGPTEDLKIEIKENGTFEVSSYDCT